jgi:hypothetical protein
MTQVLDVINQRFCLALDHLALGGRAWAGCLESSTAVVALGGHRVGLAEQVILFKVLGLEYDEVLTMGPPPGGRSDLCPNPTPSPAQQRGMSIYLSRVLSVASFFHMVNTAEDLYQPPRPFAATCPVNWPCSSSWREAGWPAFPELGGGRRAGRDPGPGTA